MNDFFTRLVLSDNHRSRIGRHLLFWFFAWFSQGVIYIFVYPDLFDPMTYKLSFGEALLYLPMHMFLSYTISYIALPYLFFKRKYWTGFITVIILILLTATLSPLSLNSLVEPFRDFVGAPSKSRTVFYSFMGGLRGSLTTSGFFVAIKLLKTWYLKTSENERLEKENLRAEVELLKSQLHPHFMFNTLNSIYSMALNNSSQTADAIHRLSNLMRYITVECNAPSISLEQEIHILKSYIELEKGRLGDRLDHSMNINGTLSGHEIAPLILLPFVENSFKHGAYLVEDIAWMSLDITVESDQFVFKLINGKNSSAKPPQLGVGLNNVKKRLALLYPQAHELRISEDEETFIVTLTLMLSKLAVSAV